MTTNKEIFVPFTVDYTPLQIAMSRFTLSVNQVADIKRMDKRKVKTMLGKEIRVEKCGKGRNGRIACNAYDVIKPIVEEMLILSYAKNK